MIRFLIALIILFYTIRTISYSVYTFRKKNITGGIAIMFLSFFLIAAICLTMMDILK